MSTLTISGRTSNALAAPQPAGRGAFLAIAPAGAAIVSKGQFGRFITSSRF
jgi:hypothetical protein